jgi:hypothetical protein
VRGSRLVPGLDESSFISGAEIAIDGGYFAAGLAGLRNRLREDFAAGRN